MAGGRYSIDVAQVATATGVVSTRLDELAGAVIGAFLALDTAMELLSGEPEVARALDEATSTRRRTGTGMIGRAGELLDAVQTNTLRYVVADGEMEVVADVGAVATPEPGVLRRGFGREPV